MSYVIDIAKIRGKDRFRVTDLEPLRLACRRLGLEFAEGETVYKVWASAQRGQPKAEHVIRLSPAQALSARQKLRLPHDYSPYEIGVVRSDADNCWYLTSDNDPAMPGSQMLAHVCGPVVYPQGQDRFDDAGPESGFGLLMQAYYLEQTLGTARSLGQATTLKQLADGTIEVETEDLATANLAGAHA